MKKKKNFMITVTLVLLTAMLLFCLYKKRESSIRWAYQDMKIKVGTELGIQNVVEPPKVEVAEYIGKDDPKLEDFKKYNEDLHKRASDSSDFLNYSISKQSIESTKKLYDKWKNTKESDSVFLPVGFDLENRDIVEYKITNSFITYDYNDIEIPEQIWVEPEKDALAHTEDGELISGYGYCIIETEITNIGSETIDEFLTNPTMAFCFLDEKGELYWKDWSDFTSFQPGENEQHSCHYHDFKSGESIKVNYLFTIPVAGFKYYDACLVIDYWGDAAFSTDDSRLIRLTELTRKMRKELS